MSHKKEICPLCSDKAQTEKQLRQKIKDLENQVTTLSSENTKLTAKCLAKEDLSVPLLYTQKKTELTQEDLLQRKDTQSSATKFENAYIQTRSAHQSLPKYGSIQNKPAAEQRSGSKTFSPSSLLQKQ